jgi:carbon monoxide dehydrogenase subunit G
MKFEHKVRVEAPKEKVKAFLDDFPAASKCVPGVEDVRLVEQVALHDGVRVYEGKYRMRLGPLGFSFAGTARVLPQENEDLWKLEMEGRDSRIGAGAKGQMDAQFLALSPSATEVSVLADVTFTGRLAELGQPLIRRKADSMVKDFAENLRKALES